ncbi:MAG TPA: magnesium transporter, partial [Sphingomicrobium sp.]|nr:magnesium transporter [Sphingomicrobium sp.]
MSDSDDLAALPPVESAAPEHTPPEPERRAVMDEDDRLRPDFVARVLDAVEAGDNVTARALVEPLHPADVADLIELAAADEREGLVSALAGIVDADVYAE